MPVQTRSTRVKALTISDPDNVPVERLSTNEKATLNFSGSVGFDRNWKVLLLIMTEYYKVLKIINKSKFTCTVVDNKNSNGLVHKCNSKHKCALCVNLKPSNSSDSSLTYRNI